MHSFVEIVYHNNIYVHLLVLFVFVCLFLIRDTIINTIPYLPYYYLTYNIIIIVIPVTWREYKELNALVGKGTATVDGTESELTRHHEDILSGYCQYRSSTTSDDNSRYCGDVSDSESNTQYYDSNIIGTSKSMPTSFHS
mmetsp:Transcript_46742/g.52785  ORF Transcript_46742/g.52785 Transcript_46742/m.52785 type:complete len:140 (+) Transcript_46742:348-767(+)